MIIIDYICVIKNQFQSVMLNLENCDFMWNSPQISAVLYFFNNFVLNLGMFRFLLTYEINLKLGYTYANDMIKFSRKLKTGYMLSLNFECYKSNF